MVLDKAVSLYHNNKANNIMTTQEQQLAAYNEAKSYCEMYINYKGDKREMRYIALSNGVVMFSARMTNFGRKLGLPTYQEYFFD